MMLDGLVFDCVRSLPFIVNVECGRSKASIRPHISDDIVMHVLSKGWCASKGIFPGAWIFSVLMRWSHADMDFSAWPHVEMVRQRSCFYV